MNKHWKNINNDYYAFFIDNKEAGKVQFFNTIDSKAIAVNDDQEINFIRRGFWKSTIEISDKLGQIIAKIYPEKWYSSTFILEHKNRNYKIVLRNNPLAEWAILEQENEVLAYGLITHQGKTSVKITSKSECNNLLFEYILWYLFRPILIENTGDDLIFLIS